MSKTLIKEFYRTIHMDDLTLAYSGEFTDSMTESIIELSEAYLDSSVKLGKLKRRTSFLVAECFQNVVRHSMKENGRKNAYNESFFLRFYENKCFIASENLIPTSLVESLKSKLDQVNKYDTKELRKLYRSMLDDGELSEEGGAGLGLIEMARKTGNKILYSFDRKDDESSLFYLMLVLENKDAEGPVVDHRENLEDIKEIIRNVQKDHMFIMYNGDFEEEIISHIEQILEENLDSRTDSLAMKVKLYHAAILIMNKIAKYALSWEKRQSGMLFVGRDEEGYMINGTFPVSDEIKGVCEKMLSRIKQTSKEELKSESLKPDASRARDLHSGIGFARLALLARTWDYTFDAPKGLPGELVYQVEI